VHVFLGSPSIPTVCTVELNEEFLMCLSLETTSEVTDDQAGNHLGTASANRFLKVFMFACKSILLKCHLRY